MLYQRLYVNSKNEETIYYITGPVLIFINKINLLKFVFNYFDSLLIIINILKDNHFDELKPICLPKNILYIYLPILIKTCNNIELRLFVCCTILRY